MGAERENSPLQVDSYKAGEERGRWELESKETEHHLSGSQYPTPPSPPPPLASRLPPCWQLRQGDQMSFGFFFSPGWPQTQSSTLSILFFLVGHVGTLLESQHSWD